jgi:hypothetical protein
MRGLILTLLFATITTGLAFGQVDQGTITGVIQDTSGAVVGNASVTLTNIDEGIVLKSKTDGAGIFIFSPVKIGNYSITATASGFETTTQTNLHLNLQERLNVVVQLKPGAATETVTVTDEAPIMQSQEGSVGQTVDTKTIDEVPLNGRNWVFIAQLAAGADPPEGSRGAGKGDFNANGQRAEQNNFILDGVDNNANVVDFYNGASFVVQPPPDALAEFKVQTSDYSAEFGHSAGAVVNASIKSGTNSIHGSAWDFIRNTAFDAHDWDNEQLPVPPYHENQFGATLGLPIFKNRLFFFGDVQANRIAFSETSTESVPTTLERAGDFYQISQGNLTGNSPVQLYYQNGTTATAPTEITGNCLVTSTYCTSNVGATANATALAILNDYPLPNANNGLLYNNYKVARPAVDNTFQWDTRVDWTIGPKDTAYSRFSYWNEMGYRTPPLGTILDGGGFGDDGTQKNLGQNYMASETHIFSPTLTNEARFGFNYMHTGFEHPNADNLDFASSVGFGGIPTASLNGGLPSVSVSGISSFGSPTWSVTSEHENVYQVLDNITKIAGNHALKAGVNFQSIRFSTLQPQQSRGSYNYTGAYTSNINASNTGYGVADFLLDDQNSAGLSNEVTNGDARWNDAVYFQDDWRATSKLTLNLGIRWEYFQPYQDVGGFQASYNMTSAPTLDTTAGTTKFGQGSGTAQYLIPKEAESYAEPIMRNNGFNTVLANNGVTPIFVSDPHLIKAQKTNFAPRIGIAYSPDSKTAIRAGYGIFYGGLESTGYYPNLGENYPFQYEANFPAGTCSTSACTTDGITIANGFSSLIAGGFASDVTDLTLRGSDYNAKTPYTQDYNLSIQRSITNDFVATVSYVGDNSHHLQVFPDPNNPLALANPSNDVSTTAASQTTRPLPDFGGSSYTAYAGYSNYNSLQTKVEKRMSKGYSLLATYTWSHSLDDAPTPLGTTGDSGYRQSTLVPIGMDYSNSGFDTRQRLTFNAYYELPFGVGRAYLNHNGLLNAVIGGWSTNATFVAQSGNPFSVGTSGITTPNNGGTNAIKTKNPFATGGTFVTPDAGISVTCPTKTKNRTNWYNPCSFQNPWNANDLTDSGEIPHYIPKDVADAAAAAALGDTTPIYVTSLSSVLGYLGGKRDDVVGPGYERVNMSLFKDFNVFREQRLTVRADIFNVLNTPSLADPSTANTSSAGGTITAPRSFQNLTPDSRFFQFSAKYSF